jgi:subtilisin family serine protease
MVAEAVAKAGPLTPLSFGPNDSLRSMIETRCGVVELTYVRDLLRENGLKPDNLADIGPGKTLLFPHCLPASLVPYVVKKDDIVGALYETRGQPLDSNALTEALKPGAKLEPPDLSAVRVLWDETDPTRIKSLAKAFAQQENVARFVRHNPRVVLTGIQRNSVIWIDSGERYGAVPLRSAVSQTQAIKDINAARTLDGLKGAAKGKAELASLVDEVTSDVFDPASCAAKAEDWPLKLADLTAALDLNTRLRPAGATWTPTTVLVIDTGADGRMIDDAAIPPPLGKIVAFRNDTDEVSSGINTAVMGEDFTAPDELPNRMHGSYVAAVIAGYGIPSALRKQMAAPNVVFASIAVTGDGAPYLDIEGIRRAIDQAVLTKGKIQIVNVSLAAPYPSSDFSGTLHKAGNNVLVIAAAGNIDNKTLGPQQLFTNATRTWPGSLGGDWAGASPGLVLSVGAYGPGGATLAFSRLGPIEVDLLAPGCQIPTADWDDGESKIKPTAKTGTSFAAPIVSLIAANLVSEGFRPDMIKQRLITSVDVDADLLTKVYSGGRLNVAKALSISRDYIVYESADKPGEILTRQAKLLNNVETVEVCGMQVEKLELRKVARAWSQSSPKKPPTWIFWRNVPNASLGQLSKTTCDAGQVPQGELTFKADDGEQFTVKMEKVVDFVSATFLTR